MSEYDEDDDEPEYGSFPVPATPKDGVVGTTPGERALGRFFKLDLPIKPTCDSQSDLAGDTFFSLYKRDAATIENVAPSRVFNKKVLDWARKNPEWNVSSTANNIPASLASAALLWSHLTSEDALKEAQEKQQEAEDKEKAAEKFLNAMAEAQEEAERAKQKGNKPAEQQAQADADSYQEAAQEAQAEAQALAQEAAEMIDKLSENPLAKGMMASAIEEAKQEGEKVAEVMRGWGIGQGDVSMDDVPEILEMADSDIARIAELVGRMQGVAAKSIEQVKRTYTGIVTEPAMVKDLGHIFPSERSKLSAKAPRFVRSKALYSLTAGGGLIGWRPKVEGKKAGAFVALVDRSGSMSGQPLAAAKGIALGMAKSLLADKDISTREYRMFYFDDGIPDVSVASQDDWRKHVEWAKLRCSGGTNISAAIQFAIGELRAMKASGIDGADLLLITDEQAPIYEEVKQEWKKLKTELNTRLLTVSINMYSWGSPNAALEELSDVIIKVGHSKNLPGMAEEIVSKLTASIVKHDQSR